MRDSLSHLTIAAMAVVMTVALFPTYVRAFVWIGHSRTQKIPTGSNLPPKLKVYASSNTVEGGQSVDLWTTVINPEASDTLSYYWETSEGNFGGSEPYDSVTWTAPTVNSSKTFVIECEVGDGQGNVDVKEVSITVTASGPTGDEEAPVINVTQLGGKTFTENENVTIRWSASDDVGLSHFTIKGWNTVSWGWETIDSNVPGSARSYNWPADLEVDKILVTAFDAAGNSSFGLTGSFTVIESVTAVPPEAPYLYGLPSTTADTYVFADWTDEEGASSYVLSIAQGSPDNVIDEQVSGISQDAVTGLDNATYYFKVKARNAAGDSPWSNIESITVNADKDPGAITLLSPGNGATGVSMSVNLQWTAEPHPGGEVVSYDVWFAESNVPYFYSGEKVSSRQLGTSFQVDNLEYNTGYKWKVVAYDESGDERTSPVFTFTTLADTTEPTGTISINNGAATTDSFSVVLNLQAEDVGSGVKYMRASNNSVTWTSWYFFSETWSSWNLTDRDYGGANIGEGDYTVYVQFRDFEDNLSIVYSDTITKVTGTPGTITLNGEIYETIRDAMLDATYGDIVYLSEGVYTIECSTWPPRYPSNTVGIVMTEGVTLRGEGADRTKIINESTCLYTVIDADDAVIEGLTIVNDNAYNRDGVLLESTGSKLTNCIVRDCDGAGIFAFNANGCEISNTLIINNNDGIYSLNSTGLEIYNNTIAYNNQWGLRESVSDIIKNNLICFNTLEGVSVINTVTFTHNDVYGNLGGNYDTGGSRLTDQTGINDNLSVDPAFEDLESYYLQSGSPVINQGTDVGAPYYGSAPDMGAYEYDFQNGTVQVSTNRAAAAFTVIGPVGTYNGSGTSWSTSSLPSGYYTVVYQPIDNEYTPLNETKFLPVGDTIMFSGTYQPDTDGPTGEISVQYDHYVTMISTVDVILNVTDPVAGLESGAEMQFSNDGATWSEPEPFSEIRIGWSLMDYGGTPDSGSKTVYARVSDALGNWSATLTDAIIYSPDRNVLEVPGEYATIQSAVDAATDGDLVLIHEGSYNEDITLADGIALQGVDPARVALDGTVTAAANNLIDGIGFENVYQGVVCNNSSPIISNNVFSNVTRPVEIYNGGSPVVRNNLMYDGGYGVMMSGSGSSTPIISNNTIADNDSAAIYAGTTTYPDRITLFNNIIANNDFGIRHNMGDSEHKIIFSSFNLFFSNINGDYSGTGASEMPGTGDSNQDPSFVDQVQRDYTLNTDSPAINTGNYSDKYQDHDFTYNDRGYLGARTYNSPPIAAFSAQTSDSVPLEVEFDATNSYDLQTNVDDLKVRWDFDGDGVFDTVFSTTKQTTHIYGAEGDYDARLQVMDQYGMIGEAVVVATAEVPNNPPNTPVLISPANGQTGVSSDVAILDWSCSDPDAGDELTFMVYVGYSPDPYLYATDVTDSTLEVPSLGYNQVIYWKVVAVDNDGAEAESEIRWFFTEDVQPPAAPTGLTAAPSGESEIQLDWTDNADDETGFVLERKLGTGGTWGQVARIGANYETYKDGLSLVPGNTYVYRIIARNQAGSSAPSNEASVDLPNTEPEIDPAIPPVSTDWITNGIMDLAYYKNDDTDWGDGLTWSVDDVNGSLLDADVTGDTLTVAPNFGIAGSDDIRLTLTDSGGLTDTQWVSVAITPPDTLPVWSELPAQIVGENTSSTDVVNLWVYVSDPGYDDSALEFSVVQMSDADCGVTVTSGHFVSINPAADFSGSCDITIRADNGINHADEHLAVYVRANEGTCAEPLVVDALPFEHGFGVSGVLDDIAGYGDGCPAGTYDQGDAVYQLSAVVGESYSITVSPQSGVDVALIVLDECGENKECLQWSDDYGPGAEEAVELDIMADGDYFIVVEGLFSSGGYDLTVTKQEGFCVIDSEVFANGADNPANPCEVCDAAESHAGWSLKDAGTPCGDPADTACTGPDTCDAAGVCQPNDEPTTKTCGDDESECTLQDYCDGSGSCKDNGHKPAGTSCGSAVSNECTAADSCDGAGVCLQNNSPDDVPCDDGNLCTSGDHCVAGECVGGASTICSDNIDCTDDVCDPATGACRFLTIHGNCPEPGECQIDPICDASLGCLYDSMEDWLSCSLGGCFDGRCEEIPAGDTCEDATGIEVGIEYDGDLAGFHGYRDVAEECGLDNVRSGPDAFYAVSLEADETYDIVLTNLSESDLGLAIWSGCDGSGVCVDSIDDSTEGTDEELAGLTVPSDGEYYVQVFLVGAQAPESGVEYSILVEIASESAAAKDGGVMSDGGAMDAGIEEGGTSGGADSESCNCRAVGGGRGNTGTIRLWILLMATVGLLTIRRRRRRRIVSSPAHGT